MSRTTSIRHAALRLAAVVAVAGLVAGAESASAGNGIYFGGNVSFKPQPEPPEVYQTPPRVFWNPSGNVSFNPQPEPPKSISENIR